MDKTLKALRRGFASSCEKTPEFKSFARTFANEFGKALAARGAQLVRPVHVNHFEVSGFFLAPSGDANTLQLFYFNTGDVRWSAEQLGMLYRTAKHQKDWTGGRNRAVSYSADMVARMSFAPDHGGAHA